MRIVMNYRGHERRLFCRGPNWWQLTLRIFNHRVALIRWW